MDSTNSRLATAKVARGIEILNHVNGWSAAFASVLLISVAAASGASAAAVGTGFDLFMTQQANLEQGGNFSPSQVTPTGSAKGRGVGHRNSILTMAMAV